MTFQRKPSYFSYFPHHFGRFPHGKNGRLCPLRLRILADLSRRDAVTDGWVDITHVVSMAGHKARLASGGCPGGGNNFTGQSSWVVWDLLANFVVVETFTTDSSDLLGGIMWYLEGIFFREIRADIMVDKHGYWIECDGMWWNFWNHGISPLLIQCGFVATVWPIRDAEKPISSRWNGEQFGAT